MSDNKSLSPYQIIQAAQKTAGRAPADTPDKNRLVDIMVFDLMVAVFTSAIEQEVVTFDAKDIQGVQATMEKIARRYMPVAEVNYDAYLAPLSEMPGGQRLSMSYARVNRSPMPLDRAVARGIFCAQALRFMRTKPETLKTFARKATPVLRDLMQVANEDNPFKAASVLAEQPTISGVGAIRRWVIEAAELMLNNVGALSSDSASFVLSKEEFEAGVLTGDVASAQNLAENIRSIERKKDLTDPMSEQAQELEVELLEVQEELKEMAQASKDQTLVETAISTTIADRDVPPSLRSMGLSEDQLAVAIASGQVLVNAGAGSGKAGSLDSKVLTPQGWKRMGDMQVGDIVITPSGEHSRVLEIHPQGLKPLWRVTFHDGASTECCGEHLWQVENYRKTRSERKAKVLPLDTIRTDMTTFKRVSYAIPVVGQLDFDPIELPLDPYLLGALLGDGTLGSVSEACFELTSQDSHIIDACAPGLQQIGCEMVPHGKYGYRIRIRKDIRGERHPLKETLRELGILGLGSSEKFIPEAYLWGSSKDRLALLRGMMDTDGTVGKRGKNTTYTTVSKRLMEDFVALVQSLGGTCRVNSRVTSYTNAQGTRVLGKKSYRATVKMPTGKNPFSLPRKADRYSEPSKYLVQRKFQSIEYLGEKEAQCITIDHPSHLYVTDDYIVTHNSHSLVAHVMHQVTENGVNPDAILLTSFTKASAMELKDRLEKKGITGRSLGRTSHSIAYGIIMQYGSRGLQEMLRQSGSNKPSECAKIAFQQLFMKPYTDTEYNDSRNVQDLARQTFTPFKKVSLAWADSRFAEMVNLGAKYAEENEGAKLDKGRLLLKVGEFKNARVKPDQAWDIYGSGKYGEANKVAAAFYVMYEWLKTADPQYGQCLDFDDQLVTAVEILEQNPRARAATQAQYDVVLIDEAQDFSQIQSQLFSLISEKASTVMYVGDDRQCVARDSLVTLQGKGEVPLSEACVGDKILAYRKGKAVFQTISVLKPSSWTEGYRVTTVSGHQLNMSPNHKIWADTRPVLKEDETLVYLMHKEGLGYRVGQTKGKWQKTGVFGRAQDEGAESMWLLAKTPNLEDALFQENMLSLRYGIPTAVFNGTKRSLNQERIQSLFDLFGQNGQNLLTDRNLDSTLPHWMKGSYSKHGRTSKTVYFDVQASTGCLIHCEAEGEGLKALEDAGFTLTPSKRGKRFRKLCKDYHTGYQLAKSLCDMWGAKLLERLCVGKERLPLINAAALLEGMSIPVLQNGETVLEEIVRIERLEGLPQGHYLDLQVDDAANFFANGILSHNSIYEWRGASPQEFIQRAKNEDVQVLSLQINYRSGSDIVEAGEQLIKYNTDQLPKSCRAPINRGPGQISYRHKGTSENVAGITADEIKTLIDSGEAKPDSFGVITRTNAEKASYMWTLAFRGIPYRSNSGTDIFKKPYLKAASAALLIASPNTPTNQRNDALVELHDQMSIGTPKIFREMDFRRKTDFVDALLNDPKPYYKARAFQAKVETLRQIVRDLLAMGQNPEVDSREIIEKVLYTPGHDEDPETGALLSIYDKMRGDAVSELVESNIDDGADKKEAEDLASGSSADVQVMTELEPLFLLADMKPNASSLADYLRKQKEVNANKDSNEPAVQIDTCHQWKGLAAEHIYVHMAGGSWPSRFAEAVEEKMEGDPTKREGFKRNPMFEERRLAYVAITRGKETVTINAPAVDSKGKGIPLSRFVGEACIPAQGQVELSEEDVQERQGNIKSGENHFKVILAEALYGTTTD